MVARVLTWWTIMRIALEERMAYRGDFALATLMRFLPIVTQIFLWWAIFQASAESTIAGYTYNQMVAYYLVAMAGRAFSSMPGLASGVALQVRNGEIKKFIVQPIDLIGFFLLSRMAHKLVYYTVFFSGFAVVAYLCRGFFGPMPDAATLAAFVASLVMAFLLGYFLELSIGLISFWFLEVSSLLFVYMLLNFFLSGHMFPLDILPPFWQTVVSFLPLKYLAYFPAAVYLGKVSGPDLAVDLAVEVLWIVFFIFTSRMMLKFGLKRYSGYGG